MSSLYGDDGGTKIQSLYKTRKRVCSGGELEKLLPAFRRIVSVFHFHLSFCSFNVVDGRRTQFQFLR